MKIKIVGLDDTKNYIETDLYLNGAKTDYRIRTNGDIVSLVYQGHVRKEPHIMIGGIDTDGYRHVTLSVDGVKYTKKVHRLVAMHFIPIPKKYRKMNMGYDDLTVNHIDGDKVNNDISNLEWMTNAENVAHAIKLGLNHNRKIEELVHDICKELESNEHSMTEISDNLVTKLWFVKKIYKRDTWTKVSKFYNIDNYKPEDHGEEHYSIRPPSFDAEMAKTICKIIEDNSRSLIEISRDFNVNKYDVLKLFHGKLYPEISKNYNFDNYQKRQSLYFVS